MVNVLMHGEWHLRVGAVDRARRSKDQVLDAVVPAAFEHGHRSLDVAIDVGERSLNAVPHAGLRTEVDDSLNFLGGEQLGHSVAIGEIKLHELESLKAFQNVETRVLQRDVVILVEIVEPDDLVAPLE